MAALCKILSGAGSRKADGTVNANGLVYFYEVGTAVQIAVWADAAGAVPLSQPVVLDGAGKRAVYLEAPCRVYIEDADGVLVEDVERYGDRAELVELESPGWTGTLDNGSQGPGGKTDVGAALGRVEASTGGVDAEYKAAVAATSRPIKSRLVEHIVSIKDWGGIGNGATDDIIAFNAALAHLVSLGGGVLYLPAGTWRFSTAPTIVAPGASITVRGAGPYATIINPAAAVNGLVAVNTDALVLEDFSVYNSAAWPLAVDGIVLQGCTRTVMRHVGTVANCRYGLSLSESTTQPLTDLTVAECSLSGYTAGVMGGAVASVLNPGGGWRFIGSDIACSDAGTTAYLAGPGSVVGVDFIGDTFLAHANAYGLNFPNTCNIWDPHIVGCHFRGSFLAHTNVARLVAPFTTFGFFEAGNSYSTTPNHVNTTGVDFVHETRTAGYGGESATNNNLTPDAATGRCFLWSIAAIQTCNAPINDAHLRLPGGELIIIVTNTSGAPVVPVWNPIYAMPGAPISVTNGYTMVFHFFWDNMACKYRPLWAQTVA